MWHRLLEIGKKLNQKKKK